MKEGFFTIKKTKLGVIGEVNYGDKDYSIVKKEQAVTKPLLLGILKLHPVREKCFFKHFYYIEDQIGKIGTIVSRSS